MLEMLREASNNHSRSIVLCCQETWKYTMSSFFLNKINKHYSIIHETAMDPSLPRGPGRPHGGICFIISKNVSYQTHYTNKRCLSIILDQYSILLSNVYMPFDDKRLTVAVNNSNYLEAIGHLRASHDLAETVTDYITVGDFNCAPSDNSARMNMVNSFRDEYFYGDTDLQYYNGRREFSHISGRLIDRVITSQHLSSFTSSIVINKSYTSSDHFPIIAEFSLFNSTSTSSMSPKKENTVLNWKKASTCAIASYSRLSNKLCKKTLNKFERGEISASVLYRETVNNLEFSARTCIPKRKQTYRNHDIPQWRENMSEHKHRVDFWLQTQFLQGGPTSCSPYVRQQLRMARAQYKRQLRTLRREISMNIADYVTERNCHKVLFKSNKPVSPAIINGHNRTQQPSMWRSHFKNVFKADNTIYSGELFDIVNEKLECNTSFCAFTTDQINTAISHIDTNKSYARHYHWKHLTAENHFAKLCLSFIFNSWAADVMNDSCHDIWDLFDTNLSLVPKNGKKDLSKVKSWRPISVGTSENWILERIFLARLSPFLGTSDCQFGYKEAHSTSHAIELVRILERSSDCHVCMLDASSAFDTLSWWRIRDQLLKRCVPLHLIKLCLKQLTSNRISVCGTSFIFPRTGIKQGGILSGRYFSICYDDLVHDLRLLGSGVFLNGFKNIRLLLFILIYADDILLISRSPYGLSRLIDTTILFARRYNDLIFNPDKSFILRLGTANLPAVSIHNIPVSNCCEYLGVEIGRGANPQRAAATTLYTKANVMLVQNKELFKCSNRVKNLSIVTYGSVYAVETFTSVESNLRQAHRYVTRAAHKDWRSYADLPGPNIRSRRLYTVYGLDSLEVIHRRRRNNFLIKAESSQNDIIRLIIGSLPRITV